MYDLLTSAAKQTIALDKFVARATRAAGTTSTATQEDGQP